MKNLWFPLLIIVQRLVMSLFEFTLEFDCTVETCLPSVYGELILRDEPDCVLNFKPGLYDEFIYLYTNISNFGET